MCTVLSNRNYLYRNYLHRNYLYRNYLYYLSVKRGRGSAPVAGVA